MTWQNKLQSLAGKGYEAPKATCLRFPRDMKYADYQQIHLTAIKPTEQLKDPFKLEFTIRGYVLRYAGQD